MSGVAAVSARTGSGIRPRALATMYEWLRIPLTAQEVLEWPEISPACHSIWPHPEPVSLRPDTPRWLATGVGCGNPSVWACSHWASIKWAGCTGAGRHRRAYTACDPASGYELGPAQPAAEGPWRPVFATHTRWPLGRGAVWRLLRIVARRPRSRDPSHSTVCAMPMPSTPWDGVQPCMWCRLHWAMLPWSPPRNTCMCGRARAPATSWLGIPRRHRHAGKPWPIPYTQGSDRMG